MRLYESESLYSKLSTDPKSRLMSDYDVSLVNDSMQEFYVRFHGPEESALLAVSRSSLLTPPNSTFRQRSVEDPRRATRPVSLQISKYWFHEQDFPSKYRWIVRPFILDGDLGLILSSNRSGSVCLDVINQTWSPMFGEFNIWSFTSIVAHSVLDMMNIFEVFLPQLLRYPNPNDPLNGEAAALLMRHPKEYDAKVKGQCLCSGSSRKQWLSGVTEYVQRFATKEAADAATDGQDEDEDEEMSDIGSISDGEWTTRQYFLGPPPCIYDQRIFLVIFIDALV